MGFELPQTPWRLIRTDPPYTVFESQYLPEGYSEEASTSWGEIKIPRREEPVLQWLAGEAETASFTARFFNTGALDAIALAQQAGGSPLDSSAILGRDVARDVVALRKSIKVDPRLGRPPRYTFEWGQDIRYQCVVTSLGGIKIGELWRMGRLRDVTFQISLRKVGSDFDLERVDPTAKPHDSLYKTMPAGNTYEALAAREYGSPVLGIFLRQRSTAAFPQPGEVVRLPVQDRFTRLRRVPQSFALSDDLNARSARLAAMAARSGSRAIPFLT